MKYVVEVHGQRLSVDLSGAHAVVDGVSMDAELTSIAGTPVRLIRIGEQVHRVIARRGEQRGSWALDVDGVRVDAEALDERMRTIRDLTVATAPPTGPAPLLAPMPGLVVRVAVAVGDSVSVGQGLVVVEAMKMENELRATAAGIVTAVHAVAGTAVVKGTVLVELAPPA